MKVLVVTSTYPNKGDPTIGAHVKEQIDSIKKQGVDVDVLFINGRKNKLNYLKGTLQVFKRSLSNNKYDLIHAQYGLTGIVSRCQLRYPVLVSFFGSDIMDKFQGKISKFLTRVINASIVKSKRLKQVLGDKRAWVIPSGVDLELFKPISMKEAREKLGLSQDKKYLLFIGEPQKKVKRFDVVKKAYKIVRENHDVELLVVSKKPHHEVPLYLNACDVLILTSDWEGSPNVIKEAMSCNLAIVSVDVGDVKEIIGNTEGCYITKRDPEDIAEKIKLVIKNDKLLTHGREKVKHLSLENIAKRIISVYLEIKKG